jgi:type IV secretory pathway TraG/TraD family ATPase VirD4
LKKALPFKENIPYIVVTLSFYISLWLSLRALFNYFCLIISQFINDLPSFFIFGDPTSPSIVGLAVTSCFLIITWLLGTKLEKYKSLGWRRIFFFNMFVGITFYYTWLLTAFAYKVLVPYLENRVSQITIENIWQGVMLGNTNNLMIFLMFIPTIVVLLIVLWIVSKYSLHSKELQEAFAEFEFKNYKLQRFFNIGKREEWPDVILGPDSDTKELVIQPGKDRTLNNIIIGSIGTGKTSALVLPILNQDLHWMSKFINKFPEIYSLENYHSEEVKGMYLNGISVIEPSNDLCQKVYQLVKAHGIPEESVFYIDPTNPNTPNINPMKGPVDQVAEAFAMVIEGLSESSDSNFFFEQSQRNHLKHYIYLLKLHEPNKEVTFDMLLDMYNNPQLVYRMHMKLKKTIPKDIDSIQDRDERNHWKIVQQVDEWFDMNLLIKRDRNGNPELVKYGEYYGDPVVYDAKAEYVQGLRNILNDIGANKLIRRVLFGKSNFDFDKHLEYGGVLLVNTAKGELANLSNVLGKLILLSLQNAVFRRSPNISSFHHILIDEFPDYIYRPFKEFPAQSRKYKVIVTVVAQTIAQLADKYGDKYMQTLLGTLRHKMVYGDIPDFDAQLFSKIFGEAERFEESMQEQSVSPLQDNPVLRAGSTYQRKKEAILSPSDLIYQKAFQCAVKIVVNNRPMPVRQIDANFVPKHEFKSARVKVDADAASYWLQEREAYLNDTIHDLVETPVEQNLYEDSSSSEHNDSQERNIALGSSANKHKQEDSVYVMDTLGSPEQPLDYTYSSESIGFIRKNEDVSEFEHLHTKNDINVDKVVNSSGTELDNHQQIEESPTDYSIPDKLEWGDILEDSNYSQIPPKLSQLGEKEENFIKDVMNEVGLTETSKQEPSVLSVFVKDYKDS